MKHILPKLKIFRARYPETAKAVLLLLEGERTATRRRFTRALPGTETHVIRGTLLDLCKVGLAERSIDGEYSLAMRPSFVVSLTPMRHPLFLQSARKLIERGLVEYRDVPVEEKSHRTRRHYTFKNPE